jgi:MOSC domain-containing protein YiiM
MGEQHWVRRFTAHGAPGAYCRVVTPGSVAAGDPVQLMHRPSHGVTIGDVFVPRRTEPQRLRALLAEPDVAPELARTLERAVTAMAEHDTPGGEP